MCQRDWENLIFQKDNNTAVAAIEMQCPTLVSLKFYSADGEAYQIAVLMALLKEVADNLNIGKSFNNQQLAFAARQIAVEYYFLKISEIRYCFIQGILGRYGQIYDRIDISVLMDWLSKYDAERCLVVEKQQQNAIHEKSKEVFYLTDAPKEIKESFENLVKKIDGQKKESIKAATMVYEYCEAKGLNFDAYMTEVTNDYELTKTDLTLDEYIENQLKNELLKIKLLKNEKG